MSDPIADVTLWLQLALSFVLGALVAVSVYANLPRKKSIGQGGWCTIQCTCHEPSYSLP